MKNCFPSLRNTDESVREGEGLIRGSRPSAAQPRFLIILFTLWVCFTVYILKTRDRTLL